MVYINVVDNKTFMMETFNKFNNFYMTQIELRNKMCFINKRNIGG